jgi:hypothetical protein
MGMAPFFAITNIGLPVATHRFCRRLKDKRYRPVNATLRDFRAGRGRSEATTKPCPGDEGSERRRNILWIEGMDP